MIGKRTALACAAIAAGLVAGLEDKSCTLEREQITTELLQSPHKLRKGMEPR